MKKIFLVGAVFSMALFFSSSFASNTVTWLKSAPNIYLDSSQAKTNFLMDYHYKISTGTDSTHFHVDEQNIVGFDGAHVTDYLNRQNLNYHPAPADLQKFELSKFTLYVTNPKQPFCDVLPQINGTFANVKIKILSDAAHGGLYCTVNGAS